MAEDREQEQDTAGNKERLMDMGDNMNQNRHKSDNGGQLVAMVDMPWASCQLEASSQMVASLDMDNAE